MSINLTSLLNTAAPRNVCQMLNQEPGYRLNRDRVGAVLHDSFNIYDIYQSNKTLIFLASLGVFGMSSYAWAKRGKRAAEANLIYPLMMLLSGGSAWVSRPDWLLSGVGIGATKPAPSPITGQQVPGFLAYLDKRVMLLRATNPGYADRAFERLVRTPGIRESWAQTPEVARVLLECGGRA